jgi:hypothetical protein
MLEDVGLARTQDIFSRVWLGQSAGYYGYLKSSGAVPSVGCLIYLSERLTDVCWEGYKIKSLSREQLARTRAISEMSMEIVRSVLDSAKDRRP